MNLEHYPFLEQINSPNDLRNYSSSQLPKISDELRHFLLNSVSRTSGHLASGLGVVELTVALHYVYNTPFDQLIWDVGHQAYPHKILTGRRDQMLTIRKKGGLHPFPWREESEYDVLSTGHSSTSISAALGIAIAEQTEQSGRKVVCVIGDGALTAGMAFEALNHAGHLKPNMLVILNDNDMSISQNIGGLNQHLTHILTSRTYASFRNSSKKVLSGIPPVRMFLKKTEEQLKNLITPINLFTQLGFNYTGPIDGHDIDSLVSTFSQIFGDWLCDMAQHDKKLVAITPAMSEGSGMVKFAENYPDQFYDVAIAEQHAITFAAGLAIRGKKPVVAIYSTFLQRGYDQLIHDVALQNLPVLFAIDRAGIVGADGPTHQGAFDISFLRCIPNLIIMTPSTANECRNMLYTGYLHNGPAVVRYPRGEADGILQQSMQIIPIGKSQLICHGNTIAILNFGCLLSEVLQSAKQLNATVIDMRFVKPLDEEAILDIAKTHKTLVTIEENAIQGGAGSAVNEFILTNKLKCDMLNIGLPDVFIQQGNQTEIRDEMGLTADKITRKIKNFIKQ